MPENSVRQLFLAPSAIVANPAAMSTNNRNMFSTMLNYKLIKVIQIELNLIRIDQNAFEWVGKDEKI